MNISHTSRSAYRSLVLASLLIAIQLGCGDEATSSSEEITPLSGTELEEARTLFQGRFALRVQSTTEQELPVVGLARSTSYTYKLLTVNETDGVFNAEERFCAVRMETEGPASPSVPMALVESIPTFATALKLTQDGDEWRWERARSGLVLGAQLDDPLNDSLPDAESDARVYDQDMDGHPGVTLNINGLIEGDIYAVIRYVDTLSGAVNADGLWSGVARDETEQLVIGASQDVLKVNVTPVAIDDPTLNAVTALPISEDAGCTQVLDTLNTHFSENWSPESMETMTDAMD